MTPTIQNRYFRGGLQSYTVPICVKRLKVIGCGVGSIQETLLPASLSAHVTFPMGHCEYEHSLYNSYIKHLEENTKRARPWADNDHYVG